MSLNRKFWGVVVVLVAVTVVGQLAIYGVAGEPVGSTPAPDIASSAPAPVGATADGGDAACSGSSGTLEVNVDDRDGSALDSGEAILYSEDYSSSESEQVTDGEATFTDVSGGSHPLEVYTDRGEFLGGETVCQNGSTSVDFSPKSPHVVDLTTTDQGDGDGTFEVGETLTVSPRVRNDDYSLEVKVEIIVEGDEVTRGPLTIDEGDSEWFGRDYTPSQGGVHDVTVRVYAEYGGGWQLTHVQEDSFTVNSPPTSSKESPSKTVEIERGETLTFTVDAFDTDGNLDGVDWYVDGSRETTNGISGTSATDSFTRTFDSTGTYTVEADVFDSERAYNDDAVLWEVEINPPTGDLTVTTLDANGNEVDDAEVILYDDEYNVVGSKRSNGGTVYWSSLVTGEYSLELYGPSGDFWGGKSVTVDSDGTDTDLQREAPRLSDVSLSDEGDGDGIFIVGDPVNISPEVRNDETTRSVRVKIEIDTNNDGSPDESVIRGDQSTTIGSGQVGYYGYNFRPSSVGTHWVRVVVEAYIADEWTPTDHSPWVQSFDVHHEIVGYDPQTGNYNNVTITADSTSFDSSTPSLPDGLDPADYSPPGTDYGDGKENISAVPGLSEEYPWSAVGSLGSWDNGADPGCTATVVEDNHIITAAHCIYDFDIQQWDREYRQSTDSSPLFMPGRTPLSSPLGNYNITYVRIYKQYILSRNTSYDVAVLTLNESVASQTGTFGYSTELYTGDARLTGYPSRFDAGYVSNDFEQWDIIVEIEDTNILADIFVNSGCQNDLCYDYSTGGLFNEFTANGLSGGPVWRSGSEDLPMILAIQSYGGADLSDAWGPRITDEKFTEIGRMVERGNDIPTASVSTNESSIQAGQSIQFDAGDSGDPDGTIETYEWDLDGDGTTDRTTSSPTVVHTYDSAGEYEVTVTVEDDDGGRATASLTVTVQESDQSIAEAIDENDDGQIGDIEILQAIEYWRTNDEVPGTGGKTLSDIKILELIEMWRTNAQL